MHLLPSISALTLAACGLAQSKPSEPAEPTGDSADRLVFRSDRGGGTNGLYLMSNLGGEVRNLVPNDREVVHFAVHPGGRRVAYVCDPNDTEVFELHVLDLEGGEQVSVHRGIRLAPQWSHDGRRLAFMLYSGRWRIRLTDPEVSIQRPEQEHIGGDGAPSWFPDDRQLAFQSNRTGRLELFVADTSTGVARQITDTPRAESSPRMSPSGEWIAFSSGTRLGIVRADGSDARLLTEDRERATGAEWAPDSKQLVLTLDRGGNRDVHIVTVDADGTDWRRLTDHECDDHSPTWSPDGERIAFVSERDGNAEIYIVAALGGDAVRVTFDPGRESSPAWVPSSAPASARPR